MTSLDALAATLRERLLAGHDVPLPGLGTLRRRRVAARMEQQPDGTQMLMPPSETVEFAPGTASDDGSLATALGQRDPTAADGAAALRAAIDDLEGRLAASGEAVLAGVGTLRRSGSGLAFAPEPGLLAAVGRSYDGLAPVSTAPATPEPPGDEPPPDASFVDEGTLDDDLDDVLSVPFGTSDSDGLKAILPLTPEHDAPPSSDAPPPADADWDAPAPPDDATVPMGATLGTSLGDALEPEASSEPETSEAEAADPEVPPSPASPPESPTPDTVVMASVDPEAPAEVVVPSPPANADLEWLDEYETPSDARGEPEVIDAAPVGAAASASAISAGPTASGAAAHALPKPPPVIAGPKPPQESRSWGWLWGLLALLAVAAVVALFVLRPFEDAPEPIATAELPADPAPASAALDTSVASGSALATDSALADVASADSLADGTAAAGVGASEAVESAALEGEFPVEELGARRGGAVAGGVPASPAPRPSAPRRPAATSSTAPPAIDEPDLPADLAEADREALTGSAPIVSGRGGFSWVVLSTRQRESADRRAREYRDAGWRVRVFQTEALGQTVFRVALGQFETRAQADRLRPLLPTQVPPDTWRLDLSTL